MSSFVLSAGKTSSWGLNSITTLSEEYEGGTLVAACAADETMKHLMDTFPQTVSITELSKYEHAASCVKVGEWYVASDAAHTQPTALQLQRLFLLQSTESSQVVGSVLCWAVNISESAGSVIRISNDLYSPEHFTRQLFDFTVATAMHQELTRSGQDCLLQKTLL